MALTEGFGNLSVILRRQTLVRFLASVSVLLGLLITTATPAAADCSGPTIDIEQREVDRGAQLVVTGYAWGDNCYDTGPPPDGEGVLGVPIDEIDVYVVQGAEEFLVATGAADDDYAFEVTIVIPAELVAGTAIVQARWAGNRIAYSGNPQIEVTDAAPQVTDEPAVATFEPTTTTSAESTTTSSATPTSAPTSTGPSATDEPDPPPSDEGDPNPDPSSSTALVLGGVAALVALVFAVLIARRRA